MNKCRKKELKAHAIISYKRYQLEEKGISFKNYFRRFKKTYLKQGK